jgi:DNA-binding transcriptional ArsR family regulator
VTTSTRPIDSSYRWALSIIISYNQTGYVGEIDWNDDRPPRELIHFVTQQTRFALLNNTLRHSDRLPSIYELEELNPSVSDATVYKHIQKLIDAGIVREVALDDDQRRQGYPWKFYDLTEEGRGFLEEHNLLAAEKTLQQIYDTISDKPKKMVKYENAPRPDDI